MYKFHFIAALMLAAASSCAASPIIVDAQGSIIGFYQGVGGVDHEEHGVTEKGYRFGFDRESGRLTRPEAVPSNTEGEVFFTSNDCSGTAYIQSSSTIRLGMILPSAYPVYPAPVTGTPSLYYLPQTGRPSEQIVQRRSQWRFVDPGSGYVLTCVVNGMPSTNTEIPLVPNDPNETGISNSLLNPPLRVISSWLFRDGFESPLGARISDSAAFQSCA